MAAGLTLVYVVARISRPGVAVLDRPAPDGVLVVRCDSPLLYPNANAVKDRVLALAAAAPPHALVLDLEASTDLDVQSADMLAELAAELRRAGAELRLARVRAPAREILRRSGLADQVRIEPTVDAAVR